ncbi:hypothetical protein Tco_1407347 [Tanacetum coccineum]
MSANSAVTYTSVHSEARSWSIPSEDPYEEAAQQLFEQAPHSPKYIPDPMELEDHVPVYIPELEHPEDLVPAEDEAPTPLLPPFFLSPRTPPLLPIPLPAPSTSRRANIPEADTPPRKRLLLTTPRPGVGQKEGHSTGNVFAPREAESSEFCTRHHDAQKDRAAVRAEIESVKFYGLLPASRRNGTKGETTRSNPVEGPLVTPAPKQPPTVTEATTSDLNWTKELTAAMADSRRSKQGLVMATLAMVRTKGKPKLLSRMLYS